MYLVEREFKFSYAHRLLHHKGECSKLHGHNARVVITFGTWAVLDSDTRMTLDFAHIKSTIGSWIKETLDHKAILNVNDPLCAGNQGYNENVALGDGNWRFGNGDVYLVGGDPTAENIAQLIYHECEVLKLPVRQVKLWETDNCSVICSKGALV